MRSKSRGERYVITPSLSLSPFQKGGDDLYAQLEIWRATAAAAASSSAANQTEASTSAAASTSYSTAQQQQSEKKPLQKEDSLDINYVLQMLEGPQAASEVAAATASNAPQQPQQQQQQQPPPPYPYAQPLEGGEPIEDSEGEKKGERKCMMHELR